MIFLDLKVAIMDKHNVRKLQKTFGMVSATENIACSKKCGYMLSFF